MDIEPELSDTRVAEIAETLNQQTLTFEVGRDGNVVLHGPSRSVVIRKIGGGIVQVDELRFTSVDAAVSAALFLFAEWPAAA
jgi:hypothetical protein